MLDRLGSYRKDIQWISGWAFVVLLTLYFFVGGVALFFAPKTAEPTLAGVFKSSMGKFSQEEYAQFKTWLQSQPADQPLQIPDSTFKFKLTNGEAAQLDAEGFKDRISKEVAERLYAGEFEELKPEQRQSLGPFLYFNRTVYEPLVGTARGLGWAAAVYGLIMVLFSRRFGRLVSLGLALMAAGLLPLVVGSLATPVLDNPAGSPPSLVAAVKDVSFPISETDLIGKAGDRPINLADGSTVSLRELLFRCQQNQNCGRSEDCRHEMISELRELSACPLIAEAIQPGSVALAATLKPALEEGVGTPAATMGVGFLILLLAGFGRLIHWLSTRGRVASGVDGAHIYEERTLELGLPYDKTFDLCLASLTAIRGMVKEQDRASGKLLAATGFTWKSSGEHVQFDVSHSEEGVTRVRVSSRPARSTTRFDFGVNRKNIERIAEFLNSQARSYQVSPGNLAKSTVGGSD